MADFSGHISVKSAQSDNSYTSSVLNKAGLDYNKIQKTPSVASVQSYAMVSGIMRNEKALTELYIKE